MMSDTLSDAICDIEDYQRIHPDLYSARSEDIEVVKSVMAALMERTQLPPSDYSLDYAKGLSPDKEFYEDVHSHRCDVCARTFKRRQDLKAHKTRTGHHFQIQKDKVTAMAVKAAKLKKRTAMQDAMPKVRWGEQEADNAWRSRYLGSIFEAGGGQMADVERDMNITKPNLRETVKSHMNMTQ